MLPYPRNLALVTVVALAWALLLCGTARGAEGTSIFDDISLIPATHPAAPQPAPNPAAIPAPTPPADAPAPRPGPPSPPALPPPAAPADAPMRKMVQPDKATIASLLKLVRQIFDKEYAQKTPTSQRALAEQLIAEADKIHANFPARFVLLEEAATAALACADIGTARKAIAGLEETFDYDATKVVTAAVARFPDTGPDSGAATGWALDAVESQIARDNYTGAREILRTISGRIAKSKDPATQDRVRSLEASLKEWERARSAIQKLKNDPNDPAANLSAGKFYCFSRRQWATGLPMLAKGSDVKLKDLAQKDLSISPQVTARFKLADQWWELAKEKAYAPFQQALEARAGYWYEQIAGNLNGLDKVLADKRIADARAGAPAIVAGPIARTKADPMLVISDNNPGDVPIPNPKDKNFAERGVQVRTQGRRVTYNHLFGEQDVLILMPNNQQTPANMDFSAVCELGAGVLKIAFHNHPGGDCIAIIKLNDKVFREFTVNGDTWIPITIPFKKGDKLIVQDQANGWHMEHLYIAFEVALNR